MLETVQGTTVKSDFSQQNFMNFLQVYYFQNLNIWSPIADLINSTGGQIYSKKNEKSECHVGGN